MFSAWAAGLVIVLFSGEKLYSLPLLAGTLLPVALYASSNPRLFLLIGAVSTSVLGLSINFARHVHIGGAPSLSIDLMDVFLLPLVVFLVRDRTVGLRSGYALSSVSFWWLGLILLGGVNMILGPFRSFASFEVVRMLKCWLLFLVIVNECVRERHFHHVVVALAWAVALNVVIAATQYALKHELGLQALGEAAPDAELGANLGVYLNASSVYRVSGLLGHPNLFSTYLAMLLPIFTALVFTGYSLRAKVAFLALTVAGVATLVLTLSRTGWSDYAAAMLCVMLFLYLHPALRGRWSVLKGTMVGIIAVVGLLASGTIVTRLTASDPGALDFRYEWLGIAWKMIQAKPVLGFGLNSFSFQLEGYAPYSVDRMVKLFGPVWPVVHNSYFLVWAEQGTIGLILFLGLHFHLLWLAWRNTQFGLSDKVTMLNVGLLAAIVAIMVDGLGSFYIRVPGPARIFWIVAGLIVASHYWNVRNLSMRRTEPSAAEPPESLPAAGHLPQRH